MEGAHFRRDMLLYQFLITAQLSSMVATDTLVIIRGGVIIKGADCQVQYTVVLGRILQDNLICLTGREGLCLGAGSHKHAVIEVALVDAPHICQTEHNDTCHHRYSLNLTPTVYKQNQCTHADDDEATHGICCEHSLTHLAHIVHNLPNQLLGNVTCTYILLHVHLVRGRDIVPEEHIRHQPEQEAHTAGCSEGN